MDLRKLIEKNAKIILKENNMKTNEQQVREWTKEKIEKTTGFIGSIFIQHNLAMCDSKLLWELWQLQFPDARPMGKMELMGSGYAYGIIWES